MSRLAPAQQTGQKKPRRGRDYVVEELEARRAMLLEMAPATDNPEFVMWKARALEEAARRLLWPHFELSPFV